MSGRNRYSRKRRTRKILIWTCLILAAVLVILLAVAAIRFHSGDENPTDPPQTTDSTPTETRPQVLDVLTVEAGSPAPAPEAFLLSASETVPVYAAAPTQVELRTPGSYPLTLVFEKFEIPVTLQVVDTVAPQGAAVDCTSTGELPQATDFVTDIVDVCAVTVTYKTEPDVTVSGVQDVTVLLTDTAGNVTEVTAKLTVILDEEAPVITGAQDRLVYAGDAISYRTGITVTDNMDAAPMLTVDSSQVDLSTPGVYELTYSSTDSSGNTASVTVTVTVMERGENFVDVDVIYEAVDALLADIITEDMTDLQKIRAIYDWVRGHCRYISHSEKDNWLQAGYRMLTERKGDCYNYFGLTKLMLERSGIPTIDVVKVPNYDGDSQHFWSLASADGGETWYHVDTTPRKVYTDFCMVTDKHMDDFSASYRNCFNRDKSLYPATPEVDPW